MTDATEVPAPPLPSPPSVRCRSEEGPASSPLAAAPVDRPDSWSTLWLTDRDIQFFTAVAAVVLVLLIVRWVQLSGWGRDEVEIDRLAPLEQTYRLDLNTATWVEFSQLEGVGETLALRIVEHRETNGLYRSVDDLDAVKGIGPKTLERLRPFLRVELRPEPAR